MAWDGRIHAFLLDTLVASTHRHQGTGKALVRLAVHEATEAGCHWLHVDWNDGLDAFYIDACGFNRTSAGLLALA